MNSSPFNIYNIPASDNFLEKIYLDVVHDESYKEKPTNVIILLPTQFSCTILKDLFRSKQIDIPKIHSVDDLSGLVSIKDLDYLDRAEIIAKIIEVLIGLDNKLLRSYQEDSSSSLYNFHILAEYIADLIHEIQLYQINLNDLLSTILADMTLYKQEFCHVLLTFFKKWLEKPYYCKSGYNNLLIEKFTKIFTKKKIWIAGISSLSPAIVSLLKKSYNNPLHKIIFHGLDRNIKDVEWSFIDSIHPQYNFKKIISVLKCQPQQVKNFSGINQFFSSFISMSLMPAALCTKWHDKTIIDQPNLKYFFATNIFVESEFLINTIKNNCNKKILLICNEDILLKNLILKLQINKLEAHIIKDTALKDAKAGILLELFINFIENKFSYISSLALLKHPWLDFSQQQLEELELYLRKQKSPEKIFKIINEEKKFQDYFFLFLEIEEQLKLFSTKNHFKSFLLNHLKLIEKLTKGKFSKEASGIIVYDFLVKLINNYSLDKKISAEEYFKLLRHFLKTSFFREQPKYSNLIIAKPIDARLLSADLVIIAGLNENSWPNITKTDQLFSPPTLERLGFPTQDQLIAQQALDFQCFIQNKEVLITRCEKIDNQTTSPSRWLVRIITLAKIKKIDLQLEYTSRSKYPSNFSRNKILHYPCPPLESRPNSLSVTQVEKLITNPYQFYVEVILSLKKLDSLEKESSALQFGIFIHLALKMYFSEEKRSMEQLLISGNKALKELGFSYPEINMFWWPRFKRIAENIFLNKKYKQIFSNNDRNKLYPEISGEIELINNFKLFSRADLLKLSLNNSTVNIIDFKTGNLPTIKRIDSGLNIQLILEGLIALYSGFNCQNQNIKYYISSLTYIELSGGEHPIDDLSINLDVKNRFDEIKNYLIKLVEEYGKEEIHFYFIHQKINYYCQYSHLFRIITLDN